MALKGTVDLVYEEDGESLLVLLASFIIKGEQS